MWLSKLKQIQKKEEKSNNINTNYEVKPICSMSSSGGQDAFWAPFFLTVLSVVHLSLYCSLWILSSEWKMMSLLHFWKLVCKLRIWVPDLGDTIRFCCHKLEQNNAVLMRSGVTHSPLITAGLEKDMTSPLAHGGIFHITLAKSWLSPCEVCNREGSQHSFFI